MIQNTKFDTSPGAVVGRLTVKQDVERDPGGRARTACVCACGKEVIVFRSALRTGRTRSCGCLMREQSAKRLIQQNTVHGRVDSDTYRRWQIMRRRCSSAQHDGYTYYGAIGITVCERWQKSFMAFLEDMGECPAGYVLVRKDKTGNYEPGNCSWAARGSKEARKACTIHVTVDGETRPLTEWADRSGLSYLTLYQRYKRGTWPGVQEEGKAA